MEQLLDSNSSFKQYILNSWNQCRSLKIDPGLQRAPQIPKNEFSSICREREDLKKLKMNTTMPITSEFRHYFDSWEHTVALTDENGVILSINGHEEFVEEASESGYEIGSSWSIESVGTNAIGNTLTLGKPICVVGKDHFVEKWKVYACAASPIRNPFSGEIIGSLNISCRADTFHFFTLSLVTSWAMTLETALRNVSKICDYKKHNLIMEQFLEASKKADIREGIIGIDLNGNILDSNKEIYSILSCEGYTPLKNISQLSPKLQERLIQSNSTAGARVTKIGKEVSGDNAYSANYIPIFNNDKMLEGWIGHLLKISSDRKAHGKRVDANIQEKYSQPIYISSSMSEIINKARKVADFASTKMLLGESGVGKEILAKFIHANGRRAAQPMIALNCASIPKELLASELFGYEAGAFTGARLKGKPGKFQMANGGTLFLDEIGDMPLDLQTYLLRVIEEKKVTRLGGTESIPLDVQIIASTNCDLKKLVDEKKFRLDLYYRLNVIPIVIPPLRERKEDILPLTEFFLEKMKEKLDGIQKKLSPEVIKVFLNYNWPGNIRELEHVIEMAHALSTGTVIDITDIGEDVLSVNCCSSENLISGQKRNAEDEEIKMTIKMCEGNMSKVAKVLHVSRTTLYRKMEKYNIPLNKDFSAPEN